MEDQEWKIFIHAYWYFYHGFFPLWKTGQRKIALIGSRNDPVKG
jgi:hypothetical protein